MLLFDPIADYATDTDDDWWEYQPPAWHGRMDDLRRAHNVAMAFGIGSALTLGLCLTGLDHERAAWPVSLWQEVLWGGGAWLSAGVFLVAAFALFRTNQKEVRFFSHDDE